MLECLRALQRSTMQLYASVFNSEEESVSDTSPKNDNSNGKCHWHGQVDADPDQELVGNADETLEARALVWLFETSTNPVVVREVFRAVPDLSHTSVNLEVFRKSKAMRLAQQHFLQCFKQPKIRDRAACTVSDMQGAVIYCHALVILSDGASQSWPIKIVECLWALQNSKDLEARALASCALSRHALMHDLNTWEIVEYLHEASSVDTDISLHVVELLLQTVVVYVKEGALSAKHVIPPIISLLRRAYDLEEFPEKALCEALQQVVGGGDTSLCPECASNIGKTLCRVCFFRTISSCLIRIVNNPSRYGVIEKQGLLVGELARMTLEVLDTEGTAGQVDQVLSTSISKATSTISFLLVNQGLLTSPGLSHEAFADVVAILARSPNQVQHSHPSIPIRLVQLLESPSTTDEAVLQNVLSIVQATFTDRSFDINKFRIFNLVGGNQVLISVGLTTVAPTLRRSIQDIALFILRKLATGFVKYTEPDESEELSYYTFIASSKDFLSNNFLDLLMDLLMSSSRTISPAVFLDLSYIMHVLCRYHHTDPQWHCLIPRFEGWLSESLQDNSESDALLEAWAHVMSMRELFDTSTPERPVEYTEGVMVPREWSSYC